jgi:hypothetical protein
MITSIGIPAHRSWRVGTAVAAAAVIGVTTLSACSGSDAPEPAVPSNSQASEPSSQVLPTTQNPISNSSTAQTLKINSVLVENNEDASGKAVDDHLEVALSNTGATPLTGFEVYYTFADSKTQESESYYAKLPAAFEIPANGQRVAHFDNTGATDHFPVNKFSLYHTDVNALNVTVQVSASGAAVQTATVKKDAGGPEEAD